MTIPGTKGVHTMSTDSSPKQELAAFGQAVRELREQRGMSLDALARASRLPRGRKMSSRRIGRIEAGEVDPRYDEMIALADALDVTPGTIIAYAEQL
jgi:transcriptional regulator with XRE-family HTH domain